MTLFSPALRALIHKEFLSVLKDRTSRMILVVPVLLYIILFGYIASFNLERIPYALCDLSHSEASYSFTRAIEGSHIFDRVATLTNTAQLADVPETTDALISVVIPADFARRLTEGQEAPVLVTVDGRNSTTAQLAAGYLASIASEFNAKRSETAPTLTMRLLFNENNITQWFILPGLILMIAMLQTVVLSALSIAREREQGTYESLLVTPVRPGEILLSKMLVPCAVGCFQSALIFAACLWWFEIPFAGRLLQLIVVEIVFLSAIVGIGLAVSAVAKSMQQALLIVIVFLVPMVLLGGLFTPVENMPEWIQTLTWIDPLRFGLVAVRRIYLGGISWSDVALTLWPAAAVACVTLPAAYIFCTRRL